MVELLEIEVQSMDEYVKTLNLMFDQMYMPVFGKDALEVNEPGLDDSQRLAQLEENLQTKGGILVKADISVIEGTDRANNYRQVATILGKAQKDIEGLVGAMGTNSNIISMHDAVMKKIYVMVAADKFIPLSMGTFYVPAMQRIANIKSLEIAKNDPLFVEEGSDMTKFVNYVRKHIGEFAKKLGYGKKQKELIYENPLLMDPIAYCYARNVLYFPGWYTRSEAGSVIKRSGPIRTGKGFNFTERAVKGPRGWNSLTAAISHDYEVEIAGFIGTGGLALKLIRQADEKNLTEDQKELKRTGNLIILEHGKKLYADTVTPCWDTNYFKGAGSGDLGKGTVDELVEKLPVYQFAREKFKQTKKS